MQEEVCAEVPVRDLFLVLRNLKIQRSSWGWRMERRLSVDTICILHLGTRLLQELLNCDLGEIGGIAKI